MPEFPEVNVQIQYLRKRCKDLPIATWGYKGKRQFEAHRTGGDTAAEPILAAFFEGNVLRNFTQRGKHIIMHTDRGLLTSHLMIKGRWGLADNPLIARYKSWTEAPPASSRGVWLGTPDGRELVMSTPGWQESAEIHPRVHRPADVPELAALGPEAILVPETEPAFARAWKVDDLIKAAARPNKPIKALLLDQKVVSGLGNLFVCEALYTARIDPRRPAKDITRAEAAAIFEAATDLLQRAIRSDLDYDSFVRIYRRETDPEGRPVEMFTIAGRDTFAVNDLQT